MWSLYYRQTQESIKWPRGLRPQVCVLNTVNYDVPQSRKRAFLFLSDPKYKFTYVPPVNLNVKNLSVGPLLKKLDEIRLNPESRLLNDELPNHSDKRIEGFSKLKPGESYYGGANNRRLDPSKICGVITSHRTRHVHPWYPRVLNVRKHR